MRARLERGLPRWQVSGTGLTKPRRKRGFALSALVGAISEWALGRRASEYVTQERMKVDAALPWRWFATVEHVRRLNRQMFDATRER